MSDEKKKYDNNNTGLVYKNPNKEPGSKQPDRKGFATIGGVRYWISGWVKDTEKYGAAISLKFEEQKPKGSEDV